MKTNKQLDTELTVPKENGTNITETDAKTKKVSKKITERIKTAFLSLTVEPFLLCYVLPAALSGNTVNKFNTEKACRIDLNYTTAEMCTNALSGIIPDNITDLAQTEALKLTSEMQSWQVPLQSSVPMLVILFVGAWSDRTGHRKALMLMPILGEFVSTLGLILATYFFLEWPLWITALIEAVPSALSGGMSIALMGSYSYIADVTSAESRTFRIGLIAVIVSMGFPIGSALSGLLTEKLGYYGLFTIDLVLYMIGIIYTILRIHDVNVTQSERSTVAKILEFFNPKNAWDTISILFLSRGRQQLQIILVICAHIVIVGPVMGEGSIQYSYTLSKFNMDLIEYGLFNAYTVSVATIGTMVAITLFSKYLKMHDSLIGIIATGCKTVSSLVYGLSPTKAWFYSGPVFDFFGNSGVTMIRSLGTKVVDPDNVGKMCGLIGFVEAILPMIAVPIYTQLFSKTIDTFPGAAYMLGAGMLVPAFFIFIALNILHKRQERDTVKNPDAKEMHAHDNDVTSL